MVYSIFFSTSVYVSFITIATKHALLKCMGIKDARKGTYKNALRCVQIQISGEFGIDTVAFKWSIHSPEMYQSPISRELQVPKDISHSQHGGFLGISIPKEVKIWQITFP